jgi:hypothetical protein
VSAVLSFSDWLLFRLYGVIACEVCGTAEYEDYYQRWLSISRRLKETGEELN